MRFVTLGNKTNDVAVPKKYKIRRRWPNRDLNKTQAKIAAMKQKRSRIACIVVIRRTCSALNPKQYLCCSKCFGLWPLNNSYTGSLLDVQYTVVLIAGLTPEVQCSARIHFLPFEFAGLQFERTHGSHCGCHSAILR